MTFKEIIAGRPYTFSITFVIVFSTCAAFILSLPSQIQVKSSVQVALERGRPTPFADTETIAKRVSLAELDLVLSTLNVTDPTLSAMRVEAAGQAIVFTSSVSEKLSDTAKAAQRLLIDKILQSEAAEVARIRGEREEALMLTRQALQSLDKDRDAVARDLTQLAESQRRMIAADQEDEHSQETKTLPKSIDVAGPSAVGGDVRERIAGRDATVLLTLTARMNFGLILAQTKENIIRYQKQLADIKNSLAAIEPAKMLQAPTTFPNRGQPSRRGLLLITALLASLLVAFLAAITKERFAS
jgi:hypothetical protein